MKKSLSLITLAFALSTGTAYAQTSNISIEASKAAFIKAKAISSKADTDAKAAATELKKALDEYAVAEATAALATLKGPTSGFTQSHRQHACEGWIAKNNLSMEVQRPFVAACLILYR